MHILMYADRAASLGGIETHLATLAGDLCRMGQRVTLAFPRIERTRLFEKPIRAGARVLQIDHSSLLRLCRAEKVDIFHAHSHGAARLGRTIYRELGVPCVVTLHSPGQAHTRFSDRQLGIICVSHEIAQPLRRDAEDVAVVENGVDVERFFPSHKNGGKGGSRYGRPLYAVYLGRVGPSKTKGILALEEALASRPEVRLTYVSNWGPKGKSSPTEEVEIFLREADFVFSTGRGIREAMACGAAAFVLGAFWDGLVTPENVERLAWYNFSGRAGRISPTAGAISVAVRELLQDRKRLAQLKTFGPEHAGRCWDSRVSAFHTLDIYAALKSTAACTGRLSADSFTA